MCGSTRSQYVRFRHFDNDLVRAARQQDFLREARQKLPAGEADPTTATSCSTSSPSTRPRTSARRCQLLELLKTFLAVQAAPVQRGPLPGRARRRRYVTANDEAIKEAVAQFLERRGHARRATRGRVAARARSPRSRRRRTSPTTAARQARRAEARVVGRRRPLRGSGDAGLDRRGPDLRQAGLGKKKKNGDPMVDFPIYYPTRLAPGLVHRPRLARVRRSTAPTRTSTTATRWSSTSPATPSATASPTSTTASPAPTGSTRRSSSNPSETRTIDGTRLPAVLRRRPSAPGRLEDQQGRLLGEQHPAAVARRGPDALDRDLDARARREVASRAT